MPGKPSILTEHPWIQILGALFFTIILIIGNFEFGYVVDDNSRLWGWPLCALFGFWGAVVHIIQPERLRESKLFLIAALFFFLFILLYAIFLFPISEASTLYPISELRFIDAGKTSLAWDFEATKISFNQALASFFFFIGVSALVSNSRGKRFVFWAIIMMALVEAFLGLASLAGPKLVRGYGVYFNPNHHAAAIMIGLPLLGAWLFERANAYQEGALSQYQRDMTLLVLLIFLIALTSWLISLSRGSVLSATFVISLFLLLDWYRMVKNHQGTNRPLSSALITPMMILLITVLLGMSFFTLIHRGEDTSLGKDFVSRTAYWEASLEGLAETKMLGMGPGGSRYAINRFVSDFALNSEPRFTHNDWLQTLCDFGIIGGLLMVVFSFLIIRRITKIIKRDWATTKKWGVGRVYRWTVASICIVLVHAFFDFHLRIPLIGFQFLSLFALISMSPRMRTGQVF